MPIGSNVALADKLIKKTEVPPQTNTATRTVKVKRVDKVNKVDIVNNVDKKPVLAETNKDNATDGTVRTTFYVKEDIYKKLHNFAYWDRHNITEAINLILSDGLKGKNTKDSPRG